MGTDGRLSIFASFNRHPALVLVLPDSEDELSSRLSVYDAGDNLDEGVIQEEPTSYVAIVCMNFTINVNFFLHSHFLPLFHLFRSF